MKAIYIVLSSMFFLLSCNERDLRPSHILNYNEPPLDLPETLMDGVILDSVMIHKGTFAPDMSKFYFTISDRQFKKFDILITELVDDVWSTPSLAFFNSDYSDHGMSFAPDGQTIWFSSTRPVGDATVADTWHIWKLEKQEDQWSVPTYVDIPNLRQRLTSHPSITRDGILYFHSSEPDYSDMKLYRATKLDSTGYGNAKALDLLHEGGACTPYVHPDHNYILYASIGSSLDLQMSYRDKDGQWLSPERLSNEVNREGQGNPSVSPDGKYLIYTAVSSAKEDTWDIKWVEIPDMIAQ